MKMISRVICIFFSMFFIFGCDRGKSDKQNENSLVKKTKAEYMADLVTRISFVELPYKHDIGKGAETTCSYQFNGESYDTLFLDALHSRIIGLLPDTAGFIGILYFTPGDDLAPSLITFDKLGNKIDDKIICPFSCNGSPCEQYLCNAWFSINKQLEITNYHELKLNRCEGGQSDISEIRDQSGYINKRGEIILNPINTSEWK